ncbi:MAG: class I SAM-dependent methyltransferase, partial [Desulfobacterales bacterium]
MKPDHKIIKSKFECPSCGSKSIHIFHDIKNIPVNSVLNCNTREAAMAFPRADISLGLCRQCGFIYNTLFDSNLVRYSSECEESQGYSPTFNAFARKLAGDLVEKYSLREKQIIEIGCGKGEFLKLMCALGTNYGVGFDPSYIPGRSNSAQALDRIEFIRDYYSEKYAGYQGDLICCRMTLEHIFDTAAFIGTIRRSIGQRTDTVIFFQVPDV